MKLRAAEAEAAEKKVLLPEKATRMRQASDPNYKAAPQVGGGDEGGDGGGTDADGSKGIKRKAANGDDAAAVGVLEMDHDAAQQPSVKRHRGDDTEAAAGTAGTAAAATGDTDMASAALPSDPAARAAKYREFFPDRDQRTAFVKNLPFKCTEEELGAFFDARGGTVTARIVRDKATGRSRGFAYVEFSEEGALQVAIMSDGAEFQGRALNIARSMPPGGAKGAGGGGGGGGGERGDKSGSSGGGGPGMKNGAGPGGGGGGQRRAPKFEGVGFAGMMPRAARVQTAAGGAQRAGEGGPGAGAAAGTGTKRTAEVKPATEVGGGGSDEKPKSNADFRAMLLSGFKKGSNLD